MTHEERAILEGRLIERALQDENLQDDPEELAQWAMKEFTIAHSEQRMVEVAARRALLTVEAYLQHREQLQAAKLPKRRTPSKNFILVVPSKGERHYLHGEGQMPSCLHHTALVGAFAGYLGQSFMVHDDPNCMKAIGETSGGPAPFTFTGNEGYTPCSACALPLAGPSLSESLAHPPLPVPADIADIFYGGDEIVPPTPPQSTRKRKKVNPLQATLFS